MMENKTKIDLKNKSIFITGVAGFIGSNLAKRLLSTVEGVKVVGLDNMNNYYDVRLKEARLKELEQFEKFSFVKGNLADKAVIESIFEQYKPEIVVNLGAQAGVRYSITNPDAYVEANLIGFYNILEACRHSYDEGHTPVEHLVYASSSSVYGSNKKVPYSTDDKVDNPVSLYAATKKSNELMAHAYSKLYNIPSTGLRFFTVYGPAGRPDMAYFGFTNKLLKGETIQIFNYGNCKRDFTYVDDIVEGVVRVMQGAPERKKGEDGLPIPPYKHILNISCKKSVLRVLRVALVIAINVILYKLLVGKYIMNGWGEWIMYAVIASIIVLVTTGLIYFITEKKQFLACMNLIIKRKVKR